MKVLVLHMLGVGTKLAELSVCCGGSKWSIIGIRILYGRTIIGAGGR